MEIMQVTGSLVCSQRVAGLNHSNLRILRNNKGKLSVAVDPVGASPGNSTTPMRMPPHRATPGRPKKAAFAKTLEK